MPYDVVFIGHHAPSADVTDTLAARGFRLHNAVSEVKQDLMQKGFPVAFVLDSSLGEVDALVAQYQALLDEPFLRTVPLYILTSNHSADRQAALEAGAVGLLTAPLDSVELLHHLQVLTGNSYTPFNLEDLSDFNVLGHDLKSPLGTVISSLELLREMTRDESTIYGLIENSVVAAYRQNMLIENMVDYMRIHNGEFEYTGKSVSVTEALAKFVTLIPDEKSRKGVPVTIEAGDNLPAVQADFHLLVRVLVALLDNALKFCTKDSQIGLQARPESAHFFIDMLDNGRRIMPHFEEKIFTPAQQFKARLGGSRTSVALNLPFARSAMRLMGGDLFISPHESLTVFTIQLTYAE